MFKAESGIKQNEHQEVMEKLKSLLEEVQKLRHIQSINDMPTRRITVSVRGLPDQEFVGRVWELALDTTQLFPQYTKQLHIFGKGGETIGVVNDFVSLRIDPE